MPATAIGRDAERVLQRIKPASARASGKTPTYASRATLRPLFGLTRFLRYASGDVAIREAASMLSEPGAVEPSETNCWLGTRRTRATMITRQPATASNA